MDFKTELAKWGYNKCNSIDVEILVDEILPSLFSQQEKSYSEKQMDDAYDKGFKDAIERSYSEEDMRQAIQLARLCTLDKEITEFIDLSGLTEICTYGLEETHSENSIIDKFKKK